MTADLRKRCGICGRLKIDAECLGTHIGDLRRRLHDLSARFESDSLSLRTPKERYEEALRRRDATLGPSSGPSSSGAVTDGDGKSGRRTMRHS